MKYNISTSFHWNCTPSTEYHGERDVEKKESDFIVIVWRSCAFMGFHGNILGILWWLLGATQPRNWGILWDISRDTIGIQYIDMSG